MKHHDQLFIDGTWRASHSGARFDVLNPATGTVVASVAEADDTDVNDAVAAARRALPAMAALTEFERAALLHRAADLLVERAQPLAEQLTAESGKPLAAEAVDELSEVAEIFRLAAEEVKRLETHVMPSIEAGKRVFTHRKPVGAYALITPFNFPMNIPAELLAAALAGGNAAVLKPSEQTPLSGAALVEACHDAGFPTGSVGLLQGRREVGAALVTHDGVDAIAFVGSHQAAENIVRSAGLKRTMLEASGNGPQIVLDDADVERAATAAVYGASFVAGQCCVATERLLVHESVHDQMVEALVAACGDALLGDPLDPNTTYGPVNNEAVAAKMDAHIADGIAKGARVVLGGARESGHTTDLFWPLTIVDGVTTDCLMFREESFGPVIPITTFATDDEAIALANDSHLGLQAAVFTRSLSRAYRFIDELRTGTVLINESTNFWEQHPPFGGAAGTRTGWGRIGGKYTLLEMTDLRTAVIDVTD